MRAPVILRARHNERLGGRAKARVRRLGVEVVFVMLGVTLSLSQAQTPVDAKRSPALDAEAYQTQQRARRLLQMDAEIRTLPDVEIRCRLRLNILEFIYSKEVRSEFPAAELLMTAFFEDMAANEKQLGDRAAGWRYSLVMTLRKHAPETAKKIEAKYVPEVDASEADLQELRKPGADLKAIVDRAVERVRTGKNMWGVLNIFEAIKDRQAAERILLAVLDRAEKQPSLDAARLLNLLMVEPPKPAALAVSPTNMLRYYRCLVAGARIELTNPKPDAYLYTLSPLRRALPKINEIDNQLYADAKTVIARYRTTLSKDALAKDEAIGRIEAAGDRLKQAIAEAESAAVRHVKDYLWGWAASLAGIKGDYRQAVDLMMNASPDLGLVTRPKGRDERLSGIVGLAVRKRDYDTANYAIDHIKDKLVRAKAMLELGNELSRWEAKNREPAIAIITHALDLMEMTVPDANSICMIGNTRYLLTTGGTPHLGLQELTARAVTMVNRIPTLGVDAKTGSPERAKFVSETVGHALLCVGYIFRPVFQGSMIPNSDLASQIKVKEWRLAAEIEAEKNRKYPLPVSLPQQINFTRASSLNSSSTQ